MSLLDNILSIFGHKPSLPSAPRPPDNAQRIYLRGDRLVWRTISDIKLALVGGDVSITGKTLDLKGAVISGKGLRHPSNSQNENSPGIVIALPGLVLRNGWVDDVPGGIVVKSSYCSFERLKFTRIGEDALSTVGGDADGIRISNCEFWNTAKGDKSIQLNQAFAAIISDTLVVGGITGIRIQKNSYNTKGVNCILRSCTFHGCETGFNATANAIVRLQSPTFKSVRKKWVLSNGAKVIEN